ncbi:L,D-transpeptidase [Jatrophihabitans sp.]|uniref:L,D-transpeptidase n=1 Tax=Jatrophihabitans sp. TaxID=1932789 RepID=UPI0030C6CA42
MNSSISARVRHLVGLTALVGATALLASACSSSGSGTGTSVQSSSTTPSSSSASTPTTSSTSAKPVVKTSPVHVSLQLSDGSQVGVGMPIIAYLSRPIKDAKAFQAATKVTVNGKNQVGAWYFETKFGLKGKPIEADWRPAAYWPGHATIHMDLPVKGVSAGTGLAFDDSLTLGFSTGPSNIATVDDASHTLTLMTDGKKEGVYPVSLGATNTPTSHGIKVIMEKGASICMSGPGYHICNVKYTQRLTYGGEYLHAAPWNVSHINGGIDSSNGCTNLLLNDAKKLYGLLEIGDVVNYPNANGPHMGLGDGYGDWNVPWAQWLTGGLYATS